MKNLAILLLLIIGITSCKGQSENKESSSITEQQEAISEEPHVKVYINAEGIITVDGVASELESLDSAFKNLKDKKGVVYYSRSEKYEGDVWIQVVDLVAKYELPIALFTDKSFSTRIGN